MTKDILEEESTNDFVGRLREKPKCRTIDGVDVEYHPAGPWDDLIEEAADRIESLQHRLDCAEMFIHGCGRFHDYSNTMANIEDRKKDSPDEAIR